MSYDPSFYQPPPQGRWPQATPPVPWPSYRDGDVYRDEERLDGQYAVDHQVAYPVTAGYQPRLDHHSAVTSYPRHGHVDEYARDSFDGAGYGSSPNDRGRRDGDQAGHAYGYGRDSGGYGSSGYGSSGYGSSTDGFHQVRQDVTAPVSYPGRNDTPPPWPSGPMLTAPDAGLRQDRWQAEQDRRAASAQRGLTVGAWTGLLAVEVAIGISTLAAAFVRPQAAPIIAGGDMFVDRVPAGLRNAAMTHFGSHGRIALLIGMYLAIACLALATGVLSRRAAALGVAGLAAFTLLGAFIVITRPGGQPTDVVPAVIGGVAGVAALLWLQRASAPVASAHGGGQPVPSARHGGRRSR